MEYHEIHQMIDKEAVKGILSSLGVNIPSSGNFKLRDEKTPSGAIYLSNGKVRIKDFGNGFNGDIFDCLIDYFNMDKQKAKSYVMNYLGLSDEVDYKHISAPAFKKAPIKDNQDIKLSSDEISKIWDKYIPLTKRHLSAEKIETIINKLIPVEYFKTANLEDKKAFLKLVKYDPAQDEPVVATFTPAGEILTIRHRRYKVYDNIIKWKSLKNTSANKYTQIRITNPADPIFIIEGTYDYTTALLLGINFIALPSKAYKHFKNDELALLRGKYNFVILPDLDFTNENDDKYSSFKKDLSNSISALLPQLEPFIKDEVFIMDMRKVFSYFKGIEKVKDLSDLCLVSDLYDSIYLKVFWILESFIYRDYYIKGENYEL